MPEASANREDAHRTATGLPEAHGVERPQIIGSTRLIYGDQFMSQLWILPRKTPKAMIGFLISALVGAAVGALIAFGPNGVLELSREDWERIGQITLWIFVIGNLVWPVLGVLIGALQWRRLRQGHRRVSYEIDNKAITTRDAEGVHPTLEQRETRVADGQAPSHRNGHKDLALHPLAGYQSRRPGSAVERSKGSGCQKCDCAEVTQPAISRRCDTGQAQRGAGALFHSVRSRRLR
jgi:hypothetical protein